MAGYVTTVGVLDNDQFSLRAMSSFLVKVLPANFSICWLTQDPHGAIRKCLDDSPNVLLVDMSLGDMDGVQVIRAIRERDAHVGLVAVTSFPLWEYAGDAAAAGAQGIVGKNDLVSMVSLIRDVASGHTGNDYGSAHFDSVQSAFRRISSGDTDKGNGLSSRESEIIELCSRGATTSVIAASLGISQATVNTHLQRACKKLGARNRVHLVTLWMKSSRLRHRV
ncbi:two-component response regulator [Bifidobacterium minimum]|uniref:Two-component response regulator n=1 Tax=Bifidobacterium minimum TaxID=1693 RepID=A0A087BM71_9BIFI|nr:response regulator transcription factor [Bifidobacterium minimum]KFI72121.1 two-component response regulator [Bifidobacterium minimum]